MGKPPAVCLSGRIGFDVHSVEDAFILQFPGAVKTVVRLRAAQLITILVEQDSLSPGWFILAHTALYVHLYSVRKLDSINDRIFLALGFVPGSGIQVALDSLHYVARDYYFRCAAKAFNMADCLPLHG